MELFYVLFFILALSSTIIGVMSIKRGLLSETKQYIFSDDLVNKDFPGGIITDKTKNITTLESIRYRGAVRLAVASFYTDEEYKKEHSTILNTKLP